MDKKIKNVIIIASYNELLALPAMLKDLSVKLSDSDAVLIVDDSTLEAFMVLKPLCVEAMKESASPIFFSNENGKSGRGAAVRRGMQIALSKFDHLETVTECDADGSHRPEDIVGVKNSRLDCDLLIGSRYLKESNIIGWPISRRIFSRILNSAIPKALDLPIKDVTNGLRRYSMSSVKIILKTPPINNGFTYLSEQACIVNNHKLSILEYPITFINRTLGSSTVTWREILNSIVGVFRLLASQKKMV